MTEVVLTLPEELARQAEFIANLTGESRDGILVRAIQSSLDPLGSVEHEDLRTPEEWSDAEVLTAADLRMAEEQDARLSELLALQRESQLSPSERMQLDALMAIYHRGMLRKACGIREAVRRGLRE